MMNVDSLVTVVAAMVSSGGVWGFLQFIVGRRSEAARAQAEQENKKDERTKMLAEAQAVAQQTALESTGKALRQVSQQYDRCLDALHALQEASGVLVDTLEVFLEEDTVANRRLVKVSIQAMRRVL